jgi:hypothetical protein
MEALHGLILKVCKNEEMPEDWKKWILCPVHKKGDILEHKSYRGICKISSSCGSEYEAQSLLGCTVMFLIGCRPTFQRCMLPPSSGQ